MEELHIDRLSPVFFAWHDSGENPHLYSSDTYGQRTVAHYEIEYIVSSRSGYILTDSIPIPTEPQSVFFRFPGMVVEGIGVYRSLYVEFDLNETKDTFNAFRRLPPVLQNTTDSPADFSYFASLCLPLRATDAQKLLWKAKIAGFSAAADAGRNSFVIIKRGGQVSTASQACPFLRAGTLQRTHHFTGACGCRRLQCILFL